MIKKIIILILLLSNLAFSENTNIKEKQAKKVTTIIITVLSVTCIAFTIGTISNGKLVKDDTIK
jgi:hypothetical protein